jgi:bacterioferritin-associated ferredoxin
MDGAMYVCICNGVTEQQVRDAADAGCASVAELTMRTGAGANCGSCIGLAAELLDEQRARRALPLPVLAQAA